MIFHDDNTNDLQVKELRQKKEENWLAFINSHEENLEKLTKRELIHLLHEFQEYVALDFPETKSISQKSMLNILDYVCRVAISLAEDVEENSFHDSYVSENLYCSITKLKREFENQC